MSNLVKLSSSLLNLVEYPASRICFSRLFLFCFPICVMFVRVKATLIEKSSAINHVLYSAADDIRSLLHLDFLTKHRHTREWTLTSY